MSRKGRSVELPGSPQVRPGRYSTSASYRDRHGSEHPSADSDDGLGTHRSPDTPSPIPRQAQLSPAQDRRRLLRAVEPGDGGRSRQPAPALGCGSSSAHSILPVSSGINLRDIYAIQHWARQAHCSTLFNRWPKTHPGFYSRWEPFSGVPRLMRRSGRRRTLVTEVVHGIITNGEPGV
jgi:hypothetical protein